MEDETLALTQSLRLDPLSGETAALPSQPPDSRDALTEDPAGAPPHLPPVRHPTPIRVGRYRVLRKLGEGGMGVVFEAYDDKLARPIALKLLRTRRSSSPARATEARERMLREAQAMAQLSHANVVQVYDQGEHEDGIFIAMELIRGRTLGAWLDELGPPSGRGPRRRELLEVFAQAGRGLAAAHAVGLVHRDFKPANVLVGMDGVARVLDFGLARGTTDPLHNSNASSSGESVELEGNSSSDLLGSMTRTGTLLGTPAYFSPEQMRALPLEAASDQFSFCVALHEALYGVRPHAGHTFEQLRESLRVDRRAELPPEVSVPSWLRAVIDRGLALDPAARWPSMNALIAAMLDDPALRRRRRALLGAASACTLILAGGWWVGERRAAAQCVALADEIHTVLSQPRRLEIMEALAHSGAGEGGGTWARLEPVLGDWASQWREARHEACVLERENADTAEVELRRDCLERQRWQYESLVDHLATAQRSAVFEAQNAVAHLPPPMHCHDPVWLAAEPPPRPWWAPNSEAAKQVRRDLASVFVLERLSDYAASEQLAERSLAHARALDDDFLEAEALAKLGMMRWRRGDYTRAESELSEAYFLAGALDYDRVASSVAAELVSVVGVRLGRYEQGQMWLELARMHLRSMGQDPNEDRQTWLWQGELDYAAGRYEDALGAHERAYAIGEATLAPGHPDLATSLHQLGQVHAQLGQYARALELSERSLELMREALGPSYPHVAFVLDNIASLQRQQGRVDEALATHEQALEIAAKTLDADHPERVTLHNNYAAALYAQGRYAEAAGQFEAVLELREGSYGSMHREVATALNNLAAVEVERGQLERAVQLMRRALAIEEASPEPKPATLATMLYNLGLWLERLGQFDEALGFKLRSLELHAELYGEQDPEYARVLRGVAKVRAAAGDHEQALADYQRVLGIRRASLGPDHARVANSLDDLASQLAALGRDQEALTRYQEALSMRERVRGPEHDSLARSLVPLAELLARLGDCERARSLSERALTLIDSNSDPKRHARAMQLGERCEARVGN